MNDIKLDNIGGQKISTESARPDKATVTSNQPVSDVQPQEGITVTSHLTKLVSLLNPTELMPNEDARVSAIKNQIQSGNYKVDINALSDKLLSNGLIRNG